MFRAPLAALRAVLVAVPLATAGLPAGFAQEAGTFLREIDADSLRYIAGLSFTIDGEVPAVTVEEAIVLTGITPEQAEAELGRRNRAELAGEDIDTGKTISLEEIVDRNGDNEIDLDTIEDTGNDNEIDLDGLESAEDDASRPAENDATPADDPLQVYDCSDTRLLSLVTFLAVVPDGMETSPNIQAALGGRAAGYLDMAESLVAERGAGCRLPGHPSGVTAGEALRMLRLLAGG